MMKLKWKVLSAFIAFILLPLIILGTITMLLAFHLIEEKYGEQSELILKALSENVNTTLGEMNNVTNAGITNHFVQRALITTETESTSIPNENYLNIVTAEKNFRNVLINHPSINYAFLYNREGEIIRFFPDYGLTPMSFDQFKQHPVYKQAVAKDGLPHWIAPYEHPDVTGSKPFFTQIRIVKDLNTLENIGTLVMQVKNWQVEKIFRSFLDHHGKQDMHILIVNHDGLIVFDNKKVMEGKGIRPFISERFEFSTGYRSFKADFDGKESIISIQSLKDYEWHMITVTSWESLSQEIVFIAYWVAAILLLSVILAMAYNLLFIQKIVRSIVHIVGQMRRVEEGDLQVRAKVEGNDETTLLSSGFNQQIEKINQLIVQVRLEQERKNKAHMMLLQAQIKPHFLFNALESINGLAMQNEGKKVSRMVQRLGNLLRISIQEQEVISIEKEIEHLRNYLEIQKFRFHDLFDFEIQIPTEMMLYSIPKLSLQPLVENSIQHGFDGINYKGVVRIIAEEEGDRINVWVEDNGVGMPNETLSQFQYHSMENDSAEPQLPAKGELIGIGVRNVADRIRIQYGPPYGLWICSMEGTGTKIKAVIPKRKIGDEHESKSIRIAN